MNITYEELGLMIDRMTPEQRACNVTVHGECVANEYYPIVSLSVATPECDVLDPDHPVLNIADNGHDEEEGLTAPNF